MLLKQLSATNQNPRTSQQALLNKGLKLMLLHVTSASAVLKASCSSANSPQIPMYTGYPVSYNQRNTVKLKIHLQG